MPLLLDSVSSEDESENGEIVAQAEGFEDINVDNWDDWEEGEIPPPKVTSTPAARTNRTSPGSSRASSSSSSASPTTPRATPATSGVSQVSSLASPAPSCASSSPSRASPVTTRVSQATSGPSTDETRSSPLKLQLYDSHAAFSPIGNIANLTEKCQAQAQKTKKDKKKVKPAVPKYSEPSAYMPSLYWSNLEKEGSKKLEVQMDIEIEEEHFLDRLLPSNSNEPITFFFSMEGCMVASITCPDMSSISFPMTMFSPVIPITYTTSNTGLLVKLLVGEEVLATGTIILPLLQSLNTNEEVWLDESVVLSCDNENILEDDLLPCTQPPTLRLAIKLEATQVTPTPPQSPKTALTVSTKTARPHPTKKAQPQPPKTTSPEPPKTAEPEPAKDAALPTVTNFGIQPVLLQVLRWKTKDFKYPIIMQYLGKEDGKVVISDGAYKAKVEVSENYKPVFNDRLISTYNILTIFEMKRTGHMNRDITLTNISVKDRVCSSLVGQPQPLPF